MQFRVRFLRTSAIAATLLGVCGASSAFAQDARTSVTSNHSFAQTTDAFKKAVSKGGMMIMGTVDQGNMLKMAGLKMNGTLFLVGNPTVGKQVFEKDPAAGLYLPIRVFIYQGSDGKTYISYDKPSADLKQFHDGTIDQTAGMLDQKLDMLTHMVAH